MKLIIAEKPSMARSIVAALEYNNEKFRNKGEYFESNEHYVTSQFGHLLELYMPEEYVGEYEGEYAPLPFFPKEYKFKIKGDSCVTRFNTIKELINRPDVDEIIHCGDADREGQLLIDLVLEKIGTTKKVTRPQIIALTPGSILSALATRKDNSVYRNLRNEGFARMISDFDFGIYLSRYCKQRTGARKIHIGRVKGAILTEIYNRDKEIENFVSTPYFKVISDRDNIKLTAKAKFEARDNAETFAKELQLRNTVVTEVKTNRITKKKPKLFSQTTLQSYMSKRYGFEPKRTLELTQAIYEAKACSYPRTDSEYLTENEQNSVKLLLTVHDPTNTELEMNYTKAVFDDSKVDSHSAIIPTDKVVKDGELTPDQQKCYNAILNRFKAVFCKEDCEYDKTTIKAENGEEVFTLTGEVLVAKGWQKFEDYAVKDKTKKKSKDTEDDDEDNEKELPKLNEGDIISTDFKAVEKHTAPPKHYTVTTLGEWMKNPFKDESKDEENDDEEYKNILAGLQIGTTATRAIILETLIKMEYMDLKKASYIIKPKGKFLVETSRELGIDFSKEKTAEMGKILKDISKEEVSLEYVIDIEHKEIEDIISANRPCKRIASSIDSIGTCPKCGKPIIQGKKGYGCSGWKEGCDFVIWMEIAHKKISTAQIKKLLSKGETDEIKGFKSKTGKEFNAKLKLKQDKSGVEFAFNNPLDNSLGNCPLCGNKIIEGKKAYGCSNYKNGCKFSIFKEMLGKKITATQVKKLLSNGETDIIKGFKSKAGKEFSCKLVLKEDKTGVTFDFAKK